MIDPNTKEEISALLIQQRDLATGKIYLRAIPEKECYSVYLLPSLWRIQYTEKDGVGGGKFAFVNKATNLELSYDHTYSATAGSGISKDNAVQEACNTTWEWYNNNLQTQVFDQVAPYAYTDNEEISGQVMIMKMTTDGLVYSFVGASSALLDNHGVLASTNAVKIQPVVATDIVLSPEAFNSMIDFKTKSQPQQAEFKFYKPNGDLLNAEAIDNLVSGGVMDPGMEYQASYDYNKILKIHTAAYEQLGGEDKLNLEKYAQAVITTETAYREAEKAYNPIYRTYREAEMAVTAAEMNHEGDSKAFDKMLNDTQSERTKLNQEAVLARSFVEKFSQYQLIYSLTPNVNGAIVEARKSTMEAAISKFDAAGTDKVAVADDARAVLIGIQNYLKCFRVSRGESVEENNLYAQMWADEIAKNVPNTISYNNMIADLQLFQQKLEDSANAVTEAQKAYETAKAALNAAEADVRKKGEAWDAAKKDLATIEGTLSAKTNYILHDGYMLLKYVANNGEAVSGNQYLMVDTAFWQTNQVPSKSDLKIAHKTPKETDAAAITARYFFKITYFPTQDSLVVEPLNASAISDNDYETGRPWRLSYAGTNFVYTEDVTEKASAPSNTYTAEADNTEKLPIVLKLDELNTSDLCLTAARANREKDTYLKTRIAFNNPYKYLTRVTDLKDGLYFIKSKNTGKYVVANFAGKLQYDVEEAGAQNYNDMPATMFVIEKPGCKNGSRSLIHNREYGNYNILPAFDGQLYQDEDGIFFINRQDYASGYFAYDQKLAIDDHYEFIPVEDEAALTSDKHGYQYLDPETLPYTEYALHYNLAANQNLYLNVEADSLLRGSEGIDTRYELVTVNPVNNRETVENAFGYGAGVVDENSGKTLKELERQAYVLKVRDANLIDNDTTYVALVEENGKNAYYKAMGINDIRAGKGQLAQFYLKADQLNDSTKYYALIDIREWTYSASVENGCRVAKYVDANGYISYTGLDNEPQERASAFRLVSDNRPLYREVNDETINLFNNSGEKMIEEIAEGKAYNYLSFANDNSKNGALEVERLALDNDRMPQYLLGVAKDSIADGYWCENNTHGYFATAEEADAADKNHYVAYNGYTSGRFLVNFVDSVLPGSHAYNKPDEYTHRGVAVRLGFVEGVHMVVTADEAKNINDFLGTEVKAGEYFFTLVGGHTLADLKNEQGYIIPERLFSYKYTEMNAYTSGKHNNWSFSFRLIDETNPEEFLIESNLPEVSAIGSMEGAWIKDYNGCPVVSYIDGNHSTIEAVGDLKKDNVTDGEIFTLKATNETATANEEISANGKVSVVATDGAVIVKGAEGKNVVVSTILGKVVANEVLNSDNETIAAPAGIVVVSVDGESFKVAVK